MKKVLFYNGISNVILELIVWMIFLRDQGWSISEIALLESVYTIFQMVFELPSGIISDKIGHKNALALGEFLCGFYILSYFFAKIHFIIYAGFIMWSLGLSLISGTDVSLLYDTVTDKEQYLKYAGYFKTIGILAIALSDATGGWIAEYSWNILFIIEMIIRVIAIVVIFSMNSEEFNDNNDETSNIKDLVINVWNFACQNKKFRLLILSMGFSSAAVTLSHQYGPLILKNLGLKVGSVSTIFGIISLIAAVIVGFTYKITKRIIEDKVVKGLISMSIIAFLIFLVKNAVITSIGLLVINVGFELWNVILENQLQRIAPKKIRASIISSVYFIELILLTCGSWLISTLTMKVNISDALGMLGTILLILSVICIASLRRTKIRS